LRVYEGNYSEYALQRARPKEASAAETPAARKRASAEQLEEQARRRAQKLLRDQENRRKELEAEIHTLETRLTVLAGDLERASQSQRVDRVHDLGREYAQVQEHLQARLEEWAEVGQA
jgi:ATPase subunit of ABC transporter with duplicated ATPase domains